MSHLTLTDRGSLAVIVAGARPGSLVTSFLSLRPLPKLGRLSYGLYLWHWPVIGLSLLWSKRQGLALGPGWVTTVAVILSLGLASITHSSVEQRFRQANFLEGRRSFALAAVLMAVPVMAMVAAVRLVDTGDRSVAIPRSSTSEFVDQGSAGDASRERDDSLTQNHDESGDTGPAMSSAEPPRLIDPPPVAERMTPAQAADDGIALGRGENCHSSGSASVEVNDSCVFGDPSGDVTVVLLGDSHAQHWLPALDHAGTLSGWRILSWTKSACPFMDVQVWDSRRNSVYEGCELWYSAVAEKLRYVTSIDAVVLARSHRYEELLYEDGVRVPRSEAPGVWEDAAVKTFRQLREVTDIVVVMPDSPWSAFDVPSCLSSNADHPARCAIELGAADGLSDSLHGAELRVQEAVEVLDPTPLICLDDPCQMVSPQGVIKYRDRHHLTETYSAMLGPRLAAELGAVLAG